jgi:hypothetical protein
MTPNGTTEDPDNEAIDIAACIPGARIVTVEIRRVIEVDGLPPT